MLFVALVIEHFLVVLNYLVTLPHKTWHKLLVYVLFIFKNKKLKICLFVALGRLPGGPDLMMMASQLSAPWRFPGAPPPPHGSGAGPQPNLAEITNMMANNPGFANFYFSNLSRNFLAAGGIPFSGPPGLSPNGCGGGIHPLPSPGLFPPTSMSCDKPLTGSNNSLPTSTPSPSQQQQMHHAASALISPSTSEGSVSKLNKVDGLNLSTSSTSSETMGSPQASAHGNNKEQRSPSPMARLTGSSPTAAVVASPEAMFMQQHQQQHAAAQAAAAMAFYASRFPGFYSNFATRFPGALTPNMMAASMPGFPGAFPSPMSIAPDQQQHSPAQAPQVVSPTASSPSRSIVPATLSPTPRELNVEEENNDKQTEKPITDQSTEQRPGSVDSNTSSHSGSMHSVDASSSSSTTSSFPINSPKV